MGATNEIIVGIWGGRQCRTKSEPSSRSKRTKPKQAEKSGALIAFEEEYNASRAARLQHVPQITHIVFREDTANGLTKAIIAHLRHNGHFATRQNSTGIYDVARGTWRASNTRKGVADISAVIDGRAVQLEIKAGRDTIRTDQLRVQSDVRAAGGIYEFVRSFSEYIDVYNAIKGEKGHF